MTRVLKQESRSNCLYFGVGPNVEVVGRVSHQAVQAVNPVMNLVLKDWLHPQVAIYRVNVRGFVPTVLGTRRVTEPSRDSTPSERGKNRLNLSFRERKRVQNRNVKGTRIRLRQKLLIDKKTVPSVSPTREPTIANHLHDSPRRNANRPTSSPSCPSHAFKSTITRKR